MTLFKNDTLLLEFFDFAAQANINTTSQAPNFSIQAILGGATQQYNAFFGTSSPLPQNANNNIISNNVDFHMEKDYFTPADGFTFVISDSNVSSLVRFMQRGWRVRVSINNCVNMIGYIFHINYSGSHDGGTILTVECKDLLECLGQSTVYPNLGTGTTNYHFDYSDTLGFCLQQIANNFCNNSGFDDISVITDSDATNLNIGSGFNFGIKGSTDNGLEKSLNHLTTPFPGESHLAYMNRLAQHAGRYLKMSVDDPSTIICGFPLYDFPSAGAAYPYQLNNYLSAPLNQSNNIEHFSYNFNLDRQPSVVIADTQTMGSGGPEFYQGNMKGIVVNELTGYQLQIINGNINPDTIPNVAEAVDSLTDNSNYRDRKFNYNLYHTRQQFPIDFNSTLSFPYYTMDHSAHTSLEAINGACQLMAQAQDHYLEVIYKIQGWTINNAIWQPNAMVYVNDQGLDPTGKKTSFTLWIRKVNYIMNKGGGTETHITCTLPYTHSFQDLING